jgi:hypothetical protein
MATESDSVRTDAIGTIMAVLALAVIVTALAVTALVRNEERNLAASRETTANLRPLRELRASQLSELNAAPNWVNREQAAISIPIAKAMELVVQEERIASKLPPKPDSVAEANPPGTSQPAEAVPVGGEKTSTPTTTPIPVPPKAGTPQPATAGAVPAKSVSP